MPQQRDRAEMTRQLTEVPPEVRSAVQMAGYENPGPVTEREVNGRKIYDVEATDPSGVRRHLDVTPGGQVVPRR